MTIELWHVGDEPTITARFTNDVGAYIDPNTVTAKIKNPAGAVTTLVYGVDAALVKDSTGVYHFTIVLTQSGNWFYQVIGVGTRAVANEGTISVQPTNF